MHRILPWLLTFLIAAPMGAATRLSLGPERPIGETSFAPWRGFAERQVFATDGDHVLIAWIAERGLFTVVLDREFKPLDRQPMVLVEARPWQFDDSTVDALWIDGAFAVFYFDHSTETLTVFLLSATGELIETRPIAGGGRFVDVEFDGREIVVLEKKRILRLNRGYTEIGSIPLPSHHYGGLALDPASKRVGVLVMEKDIITMRIFDSRAAQLLTAPVTIAPAPGSGYVMNLVWAGSEFVAVWDDWRGRTAAYMIRVTSSGLPIGTPVSLTTNDLMVGEPRVIALVGDRVFVSYSQAIPNDQEIHGRRFERGVAIDATPIKLTGHRIFRTAAGQVISVDRSLRLSRVLPFDVATPPELLPLVDTPRSERVVMASASQTEIAVIRARSDVDGVTYAASIVDLDGAPVREPALAQYGLPAAVTSDGRDFYLLWDRLLQKLGDTELRSMPTDGSSMWTLEFPRVLRGDIAMLGQSEGRLQLLAASPAGKVRFRCSVPDHARGDIAPWDAFVVDTGDDLWAVSASGGEAWITKRLGFAGCLATRVEVIRVPGTLSRGNCETLPHAWNGNTLAIPFLTPHRPYTPGGGYGLMLRHRDGRVTITDWRLDAYLVRIAAVGRYFAVSYVGSDRKHRLSLVDEHGRLVETVVLSEGLEVLASELVSIDSSRVFVISSTPEYRPPHNGEFRVYGRMVTVDQSAERQRAIRR